MSVPIYETTQRHIPEGNNLYSYCHKNLTSCLSLYSDISIFGTCGTMETAQH